MHPGVVLLSSAIFPPIPWIAAIVQSAKTFIELHETYCRQTYRNRYTILTANGIRSLTVPVVKPYGNRTKIKEIKIATDSDFHKQHIKTLKTAYNASPYFEFFCYEIETFYQTKYSYLMDMNNASVECISKLLKYDFITEFTESFSHPSTENNSFIDTRYSISPKNSKYINFAAPPYYQVCNSKFSFVSNLSVLDLIFNTGIESLLYLKNYPFNELMQKLNK